MKFALIVSHFNEEITAGLKKGALQFLNEKGFSSHQVDIFDSPGAFEIPLLAKKLAKTGRFNGVICLGCVIQGETAHFEWISMATTTGLMQAMLETEVPITFGILTTYTEEQAIARSQDNSENKGREAAAACWELVATLSQC